MRENITEWGRNLQNKTLYKFAGSGQRPEGMGDDCVGIQGCLGGGGQGEEKEGHLQFSSSTNTSKRYSDSYTGLYSP